MSFNSNEYLLAEQDYTRKSQKFSKNHDNNSLYSDRTNIIDHDKRNNEIEMSQELQKNLKHSFEKISSKHQFLDDNNTAEEKYDASYLNGDIRNKQNWVEKYSQKQRRIPVVCIKDGRFSQQYMQTAELLRKVHMHNEKQILEEKANGALTLRDLRQVVGLHGFERPSIEIRRNCILVNMPGVRCLILHDKVYYLPTSPIIFPVDYYNNTIEDEDEDFLSHISKCLNNCKNQNITYSNRLNHYHSHYNKLNHDHSIIEKLMFITRNSSEKAFEEKISSNQTEPSEYESNTRKSYQRAPLELNALEICLIEVCKKLWDSYYIIDETAQDFLVHIENNPTSTQKVYEINDLRKRLDSLRDRIKGVYEAIKEVLDDDDLLVRIEISKFWNKPENWDNKAILESTFFDSEILLECYEQEVEGLIRTVNRLNAQLDDAIEVMQIHLATIRNNFLKGEISLDIVGVCVGFVSAIASIFGMNIQSGLEKNMDIFWFMAYTMITMCVIAGFVVILMFRRLQL